MTTTQEWRVIQQLSAECRRLWPGAKVIALRPDSEFAHQNASARAEASGETENTHMQEEKTMSNDLAIIDDSDLQLLEQAANDLVSGDMVGEPLRFVKGVWKKKKDGGLILINKLSQFVVDVRSYKHGWMRWYELRPTHRYIGRKIDGWPLVTRDRLPEVELMNTKEDPWQETHSIVMRDLGAEDKPNVNGDLYTYSTSSWGGKKGIGRLIDAFTKHAKENPGKLPVVYLGTKTTVGVKGDYESPTLSICGWAEFGAGASGPGRPLTVMPPLPQLTDQSVEFGAPSLKDDLDDEIKF